MPAAFDPISATLTLNATNDNRVTGGNDLITVAVNGAGNVTINGNADLDNNAGNGVQSVAAGVVFSIAIDMGVTGPGGDDTVNLTGVTAPSFPATLTTETRFDGATSSDNTFQGSPFADDVDGADGNDIINGNGGHDSLRGDAGADTINGGAGNDRLEGGAGADTLIGGAGDDDYEFDGGLLSTDTLNEIGGGGTDALDFTDFAGAITVNLTNNLAQVVLGGVLTIDFDDSSLFENVYSAVGAFADTITGNGAGNILQGRGGNDIITGGAGNDFLEGGDGVDDLRGGDNNDTINAGGGSDLTVWGENNNDYLSGDGFSDFVAGGALGLQDPIGADINEASGIVVGRQSQQIMWSIEDAGNGTNLYANLTDGTSRGFFTLIGAGVTNVDWEELSTYNDGGTNYLYVGDIGDNDLSRGSYTIYRVAEPTILGTDTGNASRGNLSVTQRIQITFPNLGNGVRRNTEAMMVDPLTGDIYFASKGGENGGASRLYRVSKPSSASWNAGSSVAAVDSGALAFTSDTPNDSPSGASISPNGMQVLIKSDDTIKRYERGSTATSIATLLTTQQPVQLPNAKDPDNREAIAWALDNTTFYTVSEDTGSGVRPIHTYTLGSGDDSLSGGSGDDALWGGWGSDTLAGGAGNDNYRWFRGENRGASDTDTLTELANEGSDTIDLSAYGGPGVQVNLGTTGAAQNISSGGFLNLLLSNAQTIENVNGSLDAPNTLTGDAAANSLVGGSFADTISGGGGNDNIQGLDGSDVLSGDAGFDLLFGGNGDDNISGGADGDSAYGGYGNDILSGDAGNDALQGEFDNDTLVGGTGNDTLTGGSGNDTYRFDGSVGDLGSDSVSEVANVDTDTMDLSLLGAAATLDLGLTTPQTVAAGKLVLTLSSSASGIENLIGSALNDILRGNSRNNVISGGLGADEIHGFGGVDQLFANANGVNSDGAIDRLYGLFGTDSFFDSITDGDIRFNEA